jgi:tetratricopeptide (TPR) repeat protein
MRDDGEHSWPLRAGARRDFDASAGAGAGACGESEEQGRSEAHGVNDTPVARPGEARAGARCARRRLRDYEDFSSATCATARTTSTSTVMRSTILPVFAVFLAACTTPSAAPDAASPNEPVAPAEPAAAARARAELAAGKPLDALVSIEEWVKARPNDAEAWLAFGDAALAAADVQRDGNLFEDALSAYKKALALGAERPALFGASRAARATAKPAEALEFAHRGLAAAKDPTSAELRIAAEASFDVYLERRRADQEAPELLAESEESLMSLLELDANDVWALTQLANLYQWAGRQDGAAEVLARVVELQPNDQAVHERFTTIKRQVEGHDAVASYYEGLHARQPNVALVSWYSGMELFELALQLTGKPEEARQKFARAEERFAECRKLAPDYAQSCLGYEVMCRAGLGWSQFALDDLDAAERAFESMEQLFPGGMEWQIEGRLESGVKGLQYVADKALRGAPDQRGGFETAAVARAARIYAKLHAYRPSDGDIANNCGFFHREWGVALVFESREARALARAANDPALHDLHLAIAGRAERNASDVLRACRDAYLAAARIASGDVRIVNDAALILVYHFPSQADEAEALLQQAIDAGDVQKKDTNLPPEQLDLLLEAWGDAYQNMGVLNLITRGNPERAKQYFRLSHAIGPRPRVGREWAEQVGLRLCDVALAGGAVDPLELDPRIFFVE